MVTVTCGRLLVAVIPENIGALVATALVFESAMRRSALARTAASAPIKIQQRHLRATQPKEIGPLIAGIGVAAMAYGAKMLLEGVQSGKVQAAMKQAADGVSSVASGAAAAASSAASSASSAAKAATQSQQKPKKRTWEKAKPQPKQQAQSNSRPEDLDSYFTTDVMGVELGEGAKAWSGATAAILEAGAPRVVENDQGMRSTPSVVAFDDAGEVLVGQPAKKLLFSNRATPVSSFALLLGLNASSPELDQLKTAGALGELDVISSAEGQADGPAAIRVHDVAHTPEELSARVLGALKANAESALGNRTVLQAVFAAPVNASDAVRDALEVAGKRAGLRRIVLIDAPVAGACAAALELPSELAQCQRLGVYELGGRSFSFSVLERGGEAGWSVAGARRQLALGSEAFDDAVIDHLVGGFRDEHSIDLSSDHLALQRLHEATEAAKLELCKEAVASISLPFITADATGPKHLEHSLSRTKFEQLIEPTLSATSEICDLALADAGVAKSDLHALLLLGGSARLAAVEAHASKLFPGIPTLRTDRPEEAVALGAAAHAQKMFAD